jgi:Spy/CpxP family protein refolding chaperone
MSREAWSRASLWLLLIASLAFNAGVGVTFGVLTYRQYAAPDEGERAPRESRRGPRERGHGRCLARLIEKLDLTPEQAAQVRTAEEKMREDIHALRRELKNEDEALAELMSAPQPDREAVAAQLDRIALLRGTMQKQVVEHYLDMKKLLGPDQQEELNKMIRRVFSRGGPGGGGPGGPRGLRHQSGRGKRGPFHGDGE